MIAAFGMATSGSWRTCNRRGPTFLLEKEYFENRQTLDGDRISPVDWQWFVSHYRLVRTYSFNDKDYVHNAVF